MFFIHETDSDAIRTFPAAPSQTKPVPAATRENNASSERLVNRVPRVSGQPYVDTSYWSLVIEVVLYGWVAALMAFGLFPRRIDAIILAWLAITFVNELTIDAPRRAGIFHEGAHTMLQYISKLARHGR